MNAGIPIIIGGIILSVAGIVVVHLGTKGKEKPKKICGRKVYANLCEFQSYVNTCDLTLKNYSDIEDRLKIERARDEMEDVVFNNKVGTIQRIFEHRFTFNIG
jgi:hypothetical protein